MSPNNNTAEQGKNKSQEDFPREESPKLIIQYEVVSPEIIFIQITLDGWGRFYSCVCNATYKHAHACTQTHVPTLAYNIKCITGGCGKGESDSFPLSPRRLYAKSSWKPGEALACPES